MHTTITTPAGPRTFNTRQLSAENTSYYFASTLAETQHVFHDFAVSATGDITGSLTGRTSLSDVYDLYQMPGHPLLELTASDGSDAGRASAVGNRVQWQLSKMESGVLYTLVYYVKLADALDDSLHYPVFDSSDFSYSIDNEDYVKVFPVPHISPGGDIQTPPGGGGSGTATGESGGQQSMEPGAMIPLFVLPYGDTAPYVPSVPTKAPIGGQDALQERGPEVIQQETVMEDTEELAVAYTATQGEMRWMLVALAGCILTGMGVIGWRHRRGG